MINRKVLLRGKSFREKVESMSVRKFSGGICPDVINLIRLGDHTSVRQLLLDGLCPNMEDYEHGNLLHLACANERWEIAKLLIRFGANPFYENESYISGFDIALKFKETNTAIYFLEHAQKEFYKDIYISDLQKMGECLCNEEILFLLCENQARVDIFKHLRFEYCPQLMLSTLEKISPESLDYYLSSYPNSLSDLLCWGKKDMVLSFCKTVNESLGKDVVSIDDNVISLHEVKENTELDQLKKQLKAV